MSEHLRAQWRKTASLDTSGVYWRTHDRDRPFGVEDARSTPMTYTFDDAPKSRKGYSCLEDPWELWLYALAWGWMHRFIDNDEVIAFSGTPQRRKGVDGEPLVVPDLRVVRRMSWDSFERELLTTPRPARPSGPAAQRKYLDSWAAVGNAAHGYRDTSPVAKMLWEEAARAAGVKTAASTDGWITCEQGHSHWGTEGSAGLLVRHRDEQGVVRYLLQQRSGWVDHPGTWGIPGGALHSGESPEAGAVREAREEMGLDASGYRHLSTYRDDHGGWFYCTVTVEAPAQTSTTGDDGEVVGSNWFTVAEMRSLPLHPGFAQTMSRVVAKTAASKIGCILCGAYKTPERDHTGMWWCRGCKEPLECARCGQQLAARHRCQISEVSLTKTCSEFAEPGMLMDPPQWLALCEKILRAEIGKSVRIEDELLWAPRLNDGTLAQASWDPAGNFAYIGWSVLGLNVPVAVHECAHVVAGYRGLDDGHGPQWRAIYAEMKSRWETAKTAMPTSWRPVVEENHVAQHDCCILTQYVGRRRFYEVYTYGSAFGDYPSLEAAKAAVEEIYGGLAWERQIIPKVEVETVVWGLTDEFSDPRVMYYADLPRLAATVSSSGMAWHGQAWRGGARRGRHGGDGQQRLAVTGPKTAAYDDRLIARGLHVYVGIDAHDEMVPALLAGTVTVSDILRIMDPRAGVWWGIMGTFGDIADFEDYAWSDDMLADTYEDLDGGEVSVILVAKRPTRDGQPWDPEIHNPAEAGGLMGNSYLADGESVDLVEVRYNAGKGWKSLPAQGIRVTADTTATTTYYHLAPRSSRESIQTHGLDHTRGQSRWEDAPVGFNTFPRGNYLFTTREDAEAYRVPGGDFDLWAVDAGSLETHPDPLRTPHAVVTYSPVPASLMRLIL